MGGPNLRRGVPLADMDWGDPNPGIWTGGSKSAVTPALICDVKSVILVT